MDLWNAYSNARGRSDFSTVQLRLATGDRYNTSLSMVEIKGRLADINTIFMQQHAPNLRYVIAKDISFDILLTLYDASSRNAVVARLTEQPDKVHLSSIMRLLGRLRSRYSNIEMRAIGLQNGGSALLAAFEYFRKASKSRVIEVDLFGSLTRNIALDLKTGMAYNLLLLNRIYRPGELTNAIKPEEFEKRHAQLQSV